MTTPLDALLHVIDCFEALDIPYLLGGSWASMAHGLPRYTNDADLLAELSMAHIEPLISRLGDGFYVAEEAVRDAVERPDHASFNVIPSGVLFKIDVFVVKSRPYDAVQMTRRRPHVIVAEPQRSVFMASPEDTVLTKLEWYHQGGEISERQWTDVLGVLRVQADSLDSAYLEHWATVLGVAELLARAQAEAQLSADR